MDLVEQLLLGDKKALARFLRGLEEMQAWAYAGLKRIMPYVRDIPVIGIAGGQGVGKSTFIDRMIEALSKELKSIAILLVDPASESSGGAFLGDRIRMQRHADNPLVFIKSMSSRRSSGGLGLPAWWMIETLCAAGFDYVIVETMGIGQDEKEIKDAAFTTVLLVAPSQGDEIQMLKAGLLEMADIIVVNKTDLPEGELLAAYLSGFERYSKDGWKVPVVPVSARTGKGTLEALKIITEHFNFLRQRQMFAQKRLNLVRNALEKLLIHFIQLKLEDEQICNPVIPRLASGEIDPIEAVDELFRRLRCKLSV